MCEREGEREKAREIVSQLKKPCKLAPIFPRLLNFQKLDYIPKIITSINFSSFYLVKGISVCQWLNSLKYSPQITVSLWQHEIM